MELTRSILLRAVPSLYMGHLNEFVASFNQWAIPAGINNPKRIVHYLAQVFHESGQLKYVEELASGAAYDTGAKAKALGNTPEKDGDGQLYKGRGFIQLTGRTNYGKFAMSDLCFIEGIPDRDKVAEYVLTHPQVVAEFPLNQTASMWFWQTHDLNEIADLDDGGLIGESLVKRITKIVNGGQNGIAQRLFYYRRFKKEFGL